MSSRFLIPLLCAGAIVLACGPRSRNEASTPKKTSTLAQTSLVRATPVVSQQGDLHVALVKPPVVAVTGQLYIRAAQSSVRFALHVTNTSKKRVELTFPSGQSYDFVILDTLGREMWRWSTGRMFTQALRNRLLDRGETIILEETWKSSNLAAGHYIARAQLTSTNYPLVQQTEFDISATTVASR